MTKLTHLTLVIPVLRGYPSTAMRYRVGCGTPLLAVLSQIVLKCGAVFSYGETG